MYTLRKNFSLSSTVDKDIFIIGGQNYKEGCLAKCEKYNINTNQITLIKYNLFNYYSKSFDRIINITFIMYI